MYDLEFVVIEKMGAVLAVVLVRELNLVCSDPVMVEGHNDVLSRSSRNHRDNRVSTDELQVSGLNDVESSKSHATDTPARLSPGDDDDFDFLLQ